MKKIENRRNRIVDQLRHIRRKRLAAVLAIVLSAAVVLGVVAELMQPASTMTTICGHEEHTHTDACFALLLNCELEEGEDHVHTEDCYTPVEVCGLVEHTHTDACYPSRAHSEAVEEEEEVSTVELEIPAGEEAVEVEPEETVTKTADELPEAPETFAAAKHPETPEIVEEPEIPAVPLVYASALEPEPVAPAARILSFEAKGGKAYPGDVLEWYFSIENAERLTYRLTGTSGSEEEGELEADTAAFVWTAGAPGTYTLELTASSEGGEDTRAASAEVLPIPALSVTAAASERSVYAGDALSFALSAEGVEDLTFAQITVWQDNEIIYESDAFAPQVRVVTRSADRAGTVTLSASLMDRFGQTADAHLSVPCAAHETETREDWARLFEDIELTGNWPEDLLAIARAQIGSGASTCDFIVDDAGETVPWTRWAAWQGDAYAAEWSAPFVAFSLEYVGIPQKDGFPRAESVEEWVRKLRGAKLYSSDATPKPGDLVFFDTDEDGKVDHMGILSERFEDKEGGKLIVIEGGREANVNTYVYAEDDPTLAGWGLLNVAYAEWLEAQKELEPTPAPTVEPQAEPTEAPADEEIAAGELTEEEPTDETDGEETTDEEPTGEEPAEETTGEEAADEEPTGEEPAEETTGEEAADEEPIEEEPAEETTGEEAADEEPTEEEPADEIDSEETTEEEPTEEETADETTGEEAADEEPAGEEPADEEAADEEELPAALAIVSLTASSEEITLGEEAVFTFETTEADALRCRILNADEEEILASELETEATEFAYTPEAAGEYTFELTAANEAEEEVTATAKLIVKPVPLAIVSLTASSEEITLGEEAVFTFETVEADALRCRILNADEEEILASELETEATEFAYTPEAAGEYTFELTAANEAEEEVTATAKLTVKPAPLAITSLTVEPEEILVGEEAVWRFAVTGADSLEFRLLDPDGGEAAVGMLPSDASEYAFTPEVGGVYTFELIATAQPDDSAEPEAEAEAGTAAEIETETAVEAEAETEMETETAAAPGRVEASAALTAKYPFVPVAGTLEEIGEDYTVRLTYAEDAGIPEHTVMTVAEILPGSEEYASYLEQAGTTLENGDGTETVARFFDITLTFNGEELEPTGSVQVEIICAQPETEKAPEQVDVLHFAEEEAQVLEIEDNSDLEDEGVTGVAFETDSFSVYGVVYTVDFHWYVDGNTYDFSIPGGGYVSFASAMEILHVADAEAPEETAPLEAEIEVSDDTKRLVADVVDVSFSAPELVWIGRVAEETTVGTLKADNGLEVIPSADLTPEQLEEIDAQRVSAGDWAIISRKPFDSAEELAVTLKSGETFTIRVTDQQIKKTFISDSGETWEIVVEYDDDAEIPFTAELKVREILPEDDEYRKYCKAAAVKANDASAEPAQPEETEVGDASSEEEAAEPAEDDPGIRHTPKATWARFFDIEIWDGDQQIEPAAPVSVSIRLLDAPQDTEAVPAVVHFAKAGLDVMDAEETTGAPELRSAAPAGTEFKFTTDEFSVYGVVYTVVLETRVITASGETYVITVSYDESAGIPENATLEAREILEGTEEYAQYIARSRTALGRLGTEEAAPNGDADEAQDDGATLRAKATAAQDIVSARFFDISIMADGEEVEPRAPVSVSIRYVDPVELDGTESVQVVHFGDETQVIEPDVSGESAETADTFDFEASTFSVYGVLARFVTDADSGEFFIAGEDFSIRIVYGPEAQIPVGTVLTVRELDPASDDYIQRLGQAWYEVNREYFEVEEMRANYNEGMGDLPDLHLVNLDAARFFDISFEYEGEKLEPGDAVQVEISYDEGQKALGECEQLSGVAHFGEEAVELIGEVETETDANGGIVSFKYEQSSFSDTGTYVGQETFDTMVEPTIAAAPVYDPAKAITLSALGADGLLGAGSDSTSLPAPASSKTLTPNTKNGHKDGTYTLTLSVAGTSRSTNTAEVNRSNVLIVMDRSSSMKNEVTNYNEANGSYQSGTTYYGKSGDNYFTLYYNTSDGKYYRTITQHGYGMYSYYTYSNVYNGQRYTREVTNRLDEEQAALSELITQLLAKNNEFKQDSEGYLLGDDDQRVLDDNGDSIKVNDVIEISVISFADRALGDYPRTDGVGEAPNYGTEVGWSTDYTTLMAGVNVDTTPKGTNWEDALRYAKYIADTKHDAQPDEPMFVIFLTDGEPTAYAGETGGAHHYGSTTEFDKAYNPAKDEARALVTSGYEFYGIFTYGEGEAMIGYLKRLVNVAYGHEDDTTQTDDLTKQLPRRGR